MSVIGNIIGATGGLTGIPTGGLQSLIGQTEDPAANGTPGAGTSINGQPYWAAGLASAAQPVQDTVAQPVAQPAANANTIAGTGYYKQLEDQINASLGQLPQQKAIGEGNIARTYQNAYNQLTGQQQNAQAQYNDTRDQTTQDNILAKNNIDDGVRSQLTGIQRLLGAHGAGNSSAAQIFAPFAAGQNANLQRSQVQNTYGKNITGLDNDWNQQNTQFSNSLSNLNDDRAGKLNSLYSGIDAKNSELLNNRDRYQAYSGQTIDPADTARINALGQDVTNLGNIQVTPTSVPTYKPYTTDQYNYNPTATPTLGGQDSNLTQATGAYSNLLNGDPRKRLASQAPAAA